MKNTQKFTPSQITGRGTIISGSTLTPEKASLIKWNTNTVESVDGQPVHTVHIGIGTNGNGAIMISGPGGVGLYQADRASLVALISQAKRGELDEALGITSDTKIVFK